MTTWLYATGGIESPFYVVLYGAVIAIAFRYSARETMIAAVIYSASYLVLLAVLGQLAGHLTEITVRVGYVFLVASAGALFAREALRQTQAKLELHDLAQRLELEVTFGGTATVDMGDGTLPATSVPFSVTATTQGLQLTIGTTALPVKTLSAGSITIE